MRLLTQSSHVLAAALAKSAKCMSSKNAISILDHVLLTNKDGNLVFITSNASSQLTIPAPLSVVEGKFTDQKIALPITVLSQFLSTLPECKVTFTISEDDARTLTAEYAMEQGNGMKNGKATMTYLDGKEFPLMAMPSSDDTTHIQMPMSYVSSQTERADKFITANELRKIMECMNIDLAEDLSQVTFVATNDQLLFRSIYSNDAKLGGGDFYRSGAARNTLVHYTYLRTLSVFDGIDMIDIESDDDTVRFYADGIEFICKRIEGRYPNYNAVIPQSNPFHVTFDKKEMLTILKRVLLFAEKTSSLVELKKNGMFIDVSAKNIDFAQSAEDQVLVTTSECQEGFRIGFNAKNLMTAISAIPGDTVQIHMADPSRPAVLTADTPSPTMLTLVMPIMIQD